MKILTILGTRPEIIRLSKIIPTLDSVCEQVLVHTGQNFTPELDTIFFEQLNVRKPNYHLGAKGTFAEQLATIVTKLESIIKKEKPDKFLVLGDTNSSMAAIIVKRMGIPVYHMEAGNRCNDETVPEEVNRKIIDHCSTILMPYTERSKQNLINEGIPNKQIYVIGNPINEVICDNIDKIDTSPILKELNIIKNNYFLVTMHRTENVDNPERLQILLSSLCELEQEYNLPIIISTHPHTKLKLTESYSLCFNDNIRFLKPFGFFDFVKLELNAYCVISDSGTVQEECSILNVPNITIRNTTERQETQEYGSNIVTGINQTNILNGIRAARILLDEWDQIPEYTRIKISKTVAKILMST